MKRRPPRVAPTFGKEREKLDREASEELFRRFGAEFCGELLRFFLEGGDGKPKFAIGNQEQEDLFDHLSEPARRAARLKLQRQGPVAQLSTGWTAALSSSAKHWYADQRDEADQARIRALRAQGEKTRRPAPRYDETRGAIPLGRIAECSRVAEITNLRDRTEALCALVKQANDANDREVAEWFAELQVSAEHRIAELLDETAEHGERATGAHGRPIKGASVSRLADLGLTRVQSLRYRRRAAVPRETVATAIQHARETQGPPVTSAKIRKLARRTRYERVRSVLSVLEQIAEQDMTPEQWLAQLPPLLAERGRRHLVRAQPWLLRLFELWEKQNRAETDADASPRRKRSAKRK